MDKLTCKTCKCDCEVIYSKTLYNGNTDDNDYCAECFYFAHGEFFENTEFRVVDGKNEATRVKGVCQ